jgi:hypothetical protein
MLTCFVIFFAESYLSDDLAVAFRRASGITGRLYDWQAECLTAGGVLNVSAMAECLRFWAAAAGASGAPAFLAASCHSFLTCCVAILLLPSVCACTAGQEPCVLRAHQRRQELGGRGADAAPHHDHQPPRHAGPPLCLHLL